MPRGLQRRESGPCHLGAYKLQGDRNAHDTYVCSEGARSGKLLEAAALERDLLVRGAVCLEEQWEQRLVTLDCAFLFFFFIVVHYV